MKTAFDYVRPIANRHGTIKPTYDRRHNGVRHRLPITAAKGSPEFDLEVLRIHGLFEAGTPPAAKGANARPAPTVIGQAAPVPAVKAQRTLGWAVKRFYREAPEWRELVGDPKADRGAYDPKTRRYKRTTLERVVAFKTPSGKPYGDGPFEDLTGTHLVTIRNAIAKASGPSAGRAVIKEIKHLYNWLGGEGGGFLTTMKNPATGIKITTGDDEGHYPWSLAEQAIWTAKFPLGHPARTLFALGFYAGLRISDLVGIGPANLKWLPERQAWYLNWFEKKNQGRFRKERWLKIAPPLKEALDAAQADARKQGVVPLTFLVPDPGIRGEAWGKPSYTIRTLRNHFNAWVKEAGLDDRKALVARRVIAAEDAHTSLVVHGLRAAGATALAKAGASVHRLMKWGGWRTPQPVFIYTKKIDSVDVSDDAVDLFERAAA